MPRVVSVNTKCLGEHGRRVENEIILLLYNNVSEYKKHVHKIFQHLQIKTITEFFLSTVDLFISVLHIDFLCNGKIYDRKCCVIVVISVDLIVSTFWSFGTIAILQIFYVGNPLPFSSVSLYNTTCQKKRKK